MALPLAHLAQMALEHLLHFFEQPKVYTDFVMVVSTHPLMCVDTASECVDTRPSSQKTNFAELGQCVDTLHGGVDTLRLKLKNAILSRGRTWESRGISGEKLVVLGKGADPTEEAQEKKDFWHFRCHQSRASLIEENLHRFPSKLLN
ncbi:hypothetical protein Taro_019991 [Colocasia esculenta]|uniref:Uncharacterized protein n=1 Tax=Colocasia esculenta TaxID=4460 RepID=A0A843UV78_COLES|nr:hypothetical protein [Colocasia esculenta]